MTDDLGTISVSLAVNLSKLDADIAAAKKKVQGVVKTYVIPFSVGKINFDAVKRELDAFSKRQLPVQLTAARGSGSALHRELAAQLKALGPIPVKITANLSTAEVSRIRREIETALSKAPIKITTSGGGGAPAARTATPQPAAGRANPRVPGLASAPTPAPSAAPRASTPPSVVADAAATLAAADEAKAKAARAAKTKTPPATPVVATPAQPTPPPAARASSRTSKPADRRMSDPAALTEMIGNLQREIDKNPSSPSASTWKKTQNDLRGLLKTAQVPAGDTAVPETLEIETPRHANEARAAARVAATQAPAPAAKAPTAKAPRKSRSKTTAASPAPVPAAGYDWDTARAQGKTIDLNRVGSSEDAVIDALGQPTGPQASIVKKMRRTATGGSGYAQTTPPGMMPQTEEDIEYASRPMAVSLPLDEEALTQLEKRSHGARGVGRAGLRRPGERVQSKDEIAQVDRNVRRRNKRRAKERDEEIRAPGRKSDAYHGPMTDTEMVGGAPMEVGRFHPAMQRQLDLKKMERIHPRMGEAFGHMMRGDFEAMRTSVVGLGLDLKGADPKSRRKFFRQFRNIEKTKPELLTQSAGLDALFFEIRKHFDEEAVNIHGADYVPPGIHAAAAPKAKGPIESESLGDIPGADRMRADLDLISTKDFADFDERHKAERRVVLDHMHRQGITGLKPGQRIKQADAVLKALKGISTEPEAREQGGPVLGSLPVFGRGQEGITPDRWGDIGDRVKSLHGTELELRKIRTSRIQPWHATKPELLDKYQAMLDEGSPLPPIIVGDGEGPGKFKIEDGHHRLEVARRAGLKQVLAYRPPKKREQGGGIKGQPAASVFLQQFAKIGEPGLREEPGPQGEDDVVNRYVVKRDQQGRAIGRLAVQQTAAGYVGAGTTRGVHPFVFPEHRRRGIASSMYQFAEDAGMDVERVSAENYEHNFMTKDGRALFEGRHRKTKKRELGGVVEGALSRAIRMAKEKKEQEGTYLVGEKRPEVFRDLRGNHEIVGDNGPEVRSFDRDGTIIPFVPAWVRRQKQNAKDLTGARARGGKVKGRKPAQSAFTSSRMDSFWAKQNAELSAESEAEQAAISAKAAETAKADEAEKARLRDRYLNRKTGAAPSASLRGGTGFFMVGDPATSHSTPRFFGPRAAAAAAPVAAASAASSGPAKPPEYKGRFAAEPGSGLAGRKEYRESFPGERKAVAEGGLSSKGGVQRVFITNWQSGGGVSGLRSDPRRGDRAASHEMSADPYERTAGSLDRLVKALGRVRKTSPRGDGEAAEKKEADPKLSAEEAMRAKLGSYEGIGGMRETLSGIRARQPEIRSFAPVRSTGPAFGQMFATVLGRGELIKRLGQAATLTAEATKHEGLYRASLEQENKLQEKITNAKTPEKHDELTGKLEDQKKATKLASESLAEWTNKAQMATEHADSFGLKLGTMIGNTSGIAVGTLVFGAALGAAQLGITAVTQVMTPLIERLTGYQNVTASVSKGIADLTRQQGGAVKTAVAMTTAQSGLSASTAATVSPMLEQRAATEAGNAALSEAFGLVQSSITIRKQNANLGGHDKGLFATTGGQFGSLVGGIPSTQEQVVNALNQNLPTLEARKAEQATAEKAAAPAEKGLIESFFERLGEGESRRMTGRSYTELLAESQQKFNDSMAAGTEFLGTFNGALDKSGKHFQIALTNDAKAADDSAEAFKKAGLLDTAATLKKFGLAVTDTTGKLIETADQAREFFLDINKGFSAPSSEEFLKQLTERVIPAQKRMFAAQGRFQRDVATPGQVALSQLASPMAGLKGGPAFSAGLVGQSTDIKTGKIITDKDAQKAADAYEKQVGGAIEFVNKQIDVGKQALIGLVPEGLRGEFTALLGDIESTGQKISKIQIDVQQQQVNLQVAEYNNQLRIARRSLTDAKDLQAGIAGATRDTLGGIEGQNIALNRQLQLLQFELQQRQINFKLATAGFVAPGTTPEERAARIDAATKEAEFAQKQLDIQKKLASLSYKGIQITADRNVTDLVRQIGLLEQGRELTINTASAQKALEILNKKQQILLENAGAYIEEGTKAVNSVIAATYDAEVATGEAFTKILGQTARAWGIFGTQAALIMAALSGSAPVRHNSDGSRSQGGDYANGIVGDTLGRTEITVGEAGGEKVAVLKNPKIIPASSLSAGGGGGGGGGGPLIAMTVIISGNSIRDEADLETLAEVAAQKIEDRIMRKTSLFGLRRA